MLAAADADAFAAPAATAVTAVTAVYTMTPFCCHCCLPLLQLMFLLTLVTGNGGTAEPAAGDNATAITTIYFRLKPSAATARFLRCQHLIFQDWDATHSQMQARQFYYR